MQVHITIKDVRPVQTEGQTQKCILNSLQDTVQKREDTFNKIFKLSVTVYL